MSSFRLSRAVAENPQLNSLRRGGNLILLDDVTISVVVEREPSGERVPEPFGISAAQSETCRQVHDEIRGAQEHPSDELGGLSGAGWIRLIPAALLRTFIKAASRSVGMATARGAENRDHPCA